MASSAAAGGTRVARGLSDDLATLSAETRALLALVATATGDLEHAAQQQLAKRPYLTLMLAAGFGYVCGGGVPTRATSVVVNFATRLGVDIAARQIVAALATAGAEGTNNVRRKASPSPAD